MPDQDARHTILSAIRRYLIAGILAVIPIWVTWLVFDFLLGLLARYGGPFVRTFARIIEPYWPAASAALHIGAIQTVIGIVIVLLGIYVLGWFATNVIGRQLLNAFDNLMQRIPVVQTVYGSVKKLIAAVQQQPEHVQRVVLIEFPSADMKAVGLVTRTFIDSDTGRKLAAVYVPTTPNPTSGYLEIVPVENITNTDWTVDEAMTFIVSGGAVAPARLNYEKGVSGRPVPHEQDMAAPEAASGAFRAVRKD